MWKLAPAPSFWNRLILPRPDQRPDHAIVPKEIKPFFIYLLFEVILLGSRGAPRLGSRYLGCSSQRWGDGLDGARMSLWCLGKWWRRVFPLPDGLRVLPVKGVMRSGSERIREKSHWAPEAALQSKRVGFGLQSISSHSSVLNESLWAKAKVN